MNKVYKLSPSSLEEKRRSRIVATGSALPSRALPNTDLEQYMDTTDEWIRERVGIQKRHICQEDESSVSLAKEASLTALQGANLSAEDIDLIIFATVTPDQPLPSAAALLAKELGIHQSLAFDIKAACSGFIFALATADSLLQSLDLNRALVVGAESLSRVTNWRDRNTAVLFGDGAGVCILERDREGEDSCILSSFLRTQSDGVGLIQQKPCTATMPIEPATLPEKSTLQSKEEEQTGYIEMNGREVFRSGIDLMSRSIDEVLKQSQRSIDEVALFIPHQSNARMVKAVSEQVGIPFQKDGKLNERIALNIENIGNTSAASIPIAMDEYNKAGRIHQGDLLLLTAVGSGMTYGSILLEW